MPDDLQLWLDRHGLGKYAAVFYENEIDFRALPRLSEEDLRELGLPMGARRNFQAAVEQLPEAKAEASERPRAGSESPSGEAERRQLTVMFCDLAGSTQLAEQLELEEFRDIVRRYQDVCAGAISRYDGYVARYVGDGLLVYFGYPLAHEDDAERAVRSALRILELVDGLDAGENRKLAVRIGIATGLVVVGDIVGEGASQEQTVIGETPNLAARLQGIASEQTIVISSGVKRLLGEQFDFDDLGKQTLKGISEPVRAWRVLNERAVESRFGATRAAGLTGFVGREHEVALLAERWHQAKTGEGQVVLLSGEAGIGKSRIAETLRGKLAEEEYLRLQYQCSPHHVNSPLYPAIQQIRFAAGIEDQDPGTRKLEKLEMLLSMSGNVDEFVPLIAALLSIPTGDRYPPLALTPQEQKAKTLQALVGIFEGLAARHPVLFVLEDAHWIDPTTREQMDLLVERVTALPALIVITHRPEFVPPWSGYAHCTSLALNRMGHEACAQLISEIALGHALPEEVREQIISKTDGVPLFVEELTKTVLESGLLRLQGQRYELTGPLPALAIPSTLQDSLMARLDRLERVKEIAQIGAVIGREFPHELISAVSPTQGPEFDRALERLIEAQIVFRRGIAPAATYVFKHALIQDTAYESLLRSRRHQIHASVGNALCSRFPDRVENEPEIVAHHFTQAGLPDQAAPCWLKAGQRAVARSANKEAAAHLEAGLDALRDLPAGEEAIDLELDMQISLGTARIATLGYSSEDTEAAYVRGRELVENLEDDPRQFAVLHGLCMVYWNRARYRRNLEVAADLLKRAENQRDILPVLVGHRVMAVVLNPMGRFEEARHHAALAAELYDPGEHGDSAHRFGHDMGVGAHWHLSIALLFLGFREQAEDAAHRAASLARSLNHVTTTLYNGLWQAFTHMVKCEYAEAREVAGWMVDDATSRSMPLWAAYGRHMLGCALVGLDEYEAGLREIKQGRKEAERLANSVFKPVTLQFEARALAGVGRFEEAEACIESALLLVETTGERWWEAELHRLQGEICIQRDHSLDASESLFRQALDIADRQNARLLEVRSTIDLSRLYRSHGKENLALELVTPLYRWFTEGLDQPEMRTLKSMMDES